MKGPKERKANESNSTHYGSGSVHRNDDIESEKERKMKLMNTK